MKTETMHMTPHEKLRHYVTGAIERGEGEPIVEQRASHTPGPWNYSGPTMSGRFSIYANGPLAYSAGVDDYGHEAEPNARLIAAAPDLLSALENLMKRAAKDAEQYAPEGNEPIWAFISDASDAISKAKGGE